MTNSIERFAQQQLSAATTVNALEISDEVHPVSCAPLEVAAAAANATRAATETRLTARAFHQWFQGAKSVDIGFVPASVLPAGVSLTAEPMPLAGLLACYGDR